MELRIGKLGNSPGVRLPKSAAHILTSKMGFAFVCPVSNAKRKNPFYVSAPPGDQLRYLDYHAREASFIGEASQDILREALERAEPIIF